MLRSLRRFSARRRTASEKVRIVENTFGPGMSASPLARRHGVAPTQSVHVPPIDGARQPDCRRQRLSDATNRGKAGTRGRSAAAWTALAILISPFVAAITLLLSTWLGWLENRWLERSIAQEALRTEMTDTLAEGAPEF